VRYEVEVAGKPRSVTVDRVGGGFAVLVDGRAWHVDAARIDPQTLSLIVAGLSRKGDTRRRSYDAVVVPGVAGQTSVQIGAVPVGINFNGSRRRRDEGGKGGDGPQRISAPMPGKVSRLLVAVGDAVAPKQPLVVVEAMKMENELRAAQAGVVSDVHVKEGASVEAGALLMVIRS